MPRHSSLIPLSHDHHEALLIALRLKKGGPASPHDHLWSNDFQQQLHSLKLFFERELLPHFKLEEEILFPEAEKLPELMKVISKLRDQHHHIRTMILKINENHHDELIKKMLPEFGLILEAHVRLEERELFPKLEEAEKEGRVKIPLLK